MAIDYQQLHFFKNPKSALLKESPIEFLQSLSGSIVIDIDGVDTQRTRVFTTLIHGNEPSGIIAVHQWLLQNKKPATNLRFIIPSIEAALTEPVFTCRFLHGKEDLNRCFGSDKQGELYLLANEIVEAIRDVKPESIIDLHNTSGSSPAFGVAVRATDAEKNLAAYFCNQLILTGIRLGALMEMDFNCPIVTIECGGSTDQVSIKRAFHGISMMAELDDLGIELDNETVDIFHHPMRVELDDGSTLTYADHAASGKTLTLTSDNERRNFGITHKGTLLGWMNGNGVNALTTLDGMGRDISNELFKVDGDRLYTTKDLNFFMATDRADLAVKDCLFYVIEAV